MGLSMTEKNGNKTIYKYDSSNRLISVFYPSGRFVNYTYDSAGNRMSERMECRAGSQTPWRHNKSSTRTLYNTKQRGVKASGKRKAYHMKVKIRKL